MSNWVEQKRRKMGKMVRDNIISGPISAIKRQNKTRSGARLSLEDAKQRLLARETAGKAR